MTDELLAPARAAYERRAWGEAYRRLSAADEQGALHPDDLDRLATAAYLTGRGEAAGKAWERAYHACAESGAVASAVRCAFWLVLTLLQHGEHARAGGWLARAQEALARTGLDCAEQGYLRIPAALQALDAGNVTAACTEFEDIAAIADRFGDPDLRALGRLGSGQALIAGGEAARGAGMLDEAMLAVTSGEVSAITSGIVYCAVILSCQRMFDLRRAQEWTAALSRWCATHHDLRPYRGQCLVHRSEIMQLRGEWDEAMAEVRHACEHLADPPGDPVLGLALYQQAELLRLRGEFTRAEGYYRRASRSGHPVQPGLALLRLAQGRIGDAWAAMRRVIGEAEDTVERARVLAAYVEIALAATEVDAASAATGDLASIAAQFDSPYLRAAVEYARGCVLLARDDATAAAVTLRRSSVAWQRLEAPYETARVRLRLAVACRRAGDHDGAELELDAARRVFEQLGAAPALARVRELMGQRAGRAVGGLTQREVDVLELVATGATNREIAAALVISDKTVARHLANMFAKLGVTSRAAATAYAYEHGLVPPFSRPGGSRHPPG